MCTLSYMEYCGRGILLNLSVFSIQWMSSLYKKIKTRIYIILQVFLFQYFSSYPYKTLATKRTAPPNNPIHIFTMLYYDLQGYLTCSILLLQAYQFIQLETIHTVRQNRKKLWIHDCYPCLYGKRVSWFLDHGSLVPGPSGVFISICP